MGLAIRLPSLISEFGYRLNKVLAGQVNEKPDLFNLFIFIMMCLLLINQFLFCCKISIVINLVNEVNFNNNIKVEIFNI